MGRWMGLACRPSILELPAELSHQYPGAQRNLRPDELTRRNVGRSILVREIAAGDLSRPVIPRDADSGIVGRIARDLVAKQSRRRHRLRRVIPIGEARRLVALRTDMARPHPGERLVITGVPVIPRAYVEHPRR